jgi:hypothetical protein
MKAREPIISMPTCTADGLTRKTDEFAANSIARLTDLFTGTCFHALEQEADRLVTRWGERRDFRMHPTGGTPRRMTNVAQSVIEKDSPLVVRIYQNKRLRRAISSIVGAPVFDCPYPPERFVITKLHQVGDTHGWHWDDYPFALVWILKAPALESGGILQCVPNTCWDKKDPQILAQLVNHPVHSYFFASHEAYLMNTRTTLHRVYPLLRAGTERLILNCAFAVEEDLSNHNITHETVAELWPASD